MDTPVILFVYNRIEHTKQTIDALGAVHNSTLIDLIIYSDGPKNDQTDIQKVEHVRSYLNHISKSHPFKSIRLIDRAKNLGLSQSVLSGVTSVISQSQQAIVLEDDIVVSPTFYDIMNRLLEAYKNDLDVSSISGYMYPVQLPQSCDDFFLLKRASSWGWATWRDRWEKVDWDVKDYDQFIESRDLQRNFNEGGEDLTPMLIKWKKGLNDSWAVRWCYHHFKTSTYGIFPKTSIVSNIGHDGSGTHSKNSNRYNQVLNSSTKLSLPFSLQEDSVITNNIKMFFKLSPIRRLINKLTL